MRSVYKRAFDSLGADEQQIQDRIGRIKKQYRADEQAAQGQRPKSKFKTFFFSTRRGIAAFTASVLLIVSISVALPVGIWLSGDDGMLRTLTLLKGTYVDMTGVAAFGVWQAGGDTTGNSAASKAAGSTGTIRNLSAVNAANDDLQDWESDYDWDPDKANVLITVTDEGKIEEVVYERTNGRGQVRQDKLGNAAKVYVADGFTYVLYVDDNTWQFWETADFAQEMLWPQGFGCLHEREQTIVIHNETGKVYALKDIMPMISEMAGAKQYTLGIHPFFDDIISVSSMSGRMQNLWFKVRFDESLNNIVYERIADDDVSVQSVRRDIYGNYYILNGTQKSSIPEYDFPASKRLDEKIGNELYFTSENELFYGADRRVYAFVDDCLMVYNADFELEPVSEAAETAFEGITDSFYPHYYNFSNLGRCYVLRNGYLFSMYGEVWKLGAGGKLTRLAALRGSFPKYAEDCYILGGELIAFVDVQRIEGNSASGRVVHIDFSKFSAANPVAEITGIIGAGRIYCNNKRLIAEQTANPYYEYSEDSKYFMITVENGMPVAEFVAYYDKNDTLTLGGRLKLVKPITEPLRQY